MRVASTILSRFKTCLSGIEPDKHSLDRGYFENERYIELPKSITPQPFMVFITLVFLAEFEYFGKHEKQLWAIPIIYKSTPFLLAHRKFGFGIYGFKNDKLTEENLAKELIIKVNKAIQYAEELIQPFVDDQLRKGNITISNKYIELNMMYRFFRAKARNAFKRKQPPKKIISRDKEGKPNAWSGDPFRPEREGFYYAVATIDAFFSRLEHILILSLPFFGFNRATDYLPDLISSNWTDKYKQIFNLKVEKEAMQNYDELKRIKERYRNTLSHGFFEKDTGSLFFHCGSIGAIPVYLSKFEKTIHYSFFPIKESSFADICKFFDKVDKFLRTGKTKYVLKYAESGLSVSFSEKSIEEYRTASQSNGNFNSFLGHESYVADMHDNMDF